MGGLGAEAESVYGKGDLGVNVGDGEAKVATWIELRVVFPGDSFFEESRDEYEKAMLKRAVAEAFELLKGGKA